MNDDGDTKDDVRMPDGEIGEKINKLFKVDEKDTSKNLLRFVNDFYTLETASILIIPPRRCYSHLDG